LKNGVKLKKLRLIGTELTGTLRILITVYRTGFIVLSIIHSIIPEKEKGQPLGKNLTSTNPLTSLDTVFLLEDRLADRPNILRYEVELEEAEGGQNPRISELVEYLIRLLEPYGLTVNNLPRGVRKVIHLWNPQLCSKSNFLKLLKDNYKDLFLIFTTPLHGTLPKRSKKDILKNLKSSLLWSSKKRGIFFDSTTILMVSPRAQHPHRILRTPIPWIYQLVSTEDFMLKFFSKEVRKLTPKIVTGSSSRYSTLLSEIIKLNTAFSLCLEDLYWVESDLFRFQSARFVAEYKKRFKLEEKLAALQRRFAWLKDRCLDALTALEHRTQREREKSITNLTLVFATFGLGEIISTFIVWYFTSIQAGALGIPVGFLISGLLMPFLIIITIYFICRWFVNKKYEENRL